MPELTLRDYVRQQAARWRVPEELAFAVIDQESNGVHQPAGQGTLTSGKRAHGLFQVLPETGRGEFGLNVDDPFENIEAGVRYLRQGLDRNAGDLDRALAHYHGGPDLPQHGPLTAGYVRAVKGKFIDRLQNPAPTPQAPLRAATNQVGPPLRAAANQVGPPLAAAANAPSPAPSAPTAAAPRGTLYSPQDVERAWQAAHTFATET